MQLENAGGKGIKIKESRMSVDRKITTGVYSLGSQLIRSGCSVDICCWLLFLNQQTNSKKDRDRDLCTG